MKKTHEIKSILRSKNNSSRACTRQHLLRPINLCIWLHFFSLSPNNRLFRKMQRAFLNTADTMLCDSPNSRTTTCCVSKIRVIKLTFSLFPAAHPHKHTELSHPQTFSFCLPLLHFWLFFVDCRVSKKKNIHLYSVNTCSDTVSSKRWGQKGWIFLNYFSYCDAAAAGCCIIRTLGFYAFQKFNTSELYTQLFSFIFSLSLFFSIQFNRIDRHYV